MAQYSKPAASAAKETFPKRQRSAHRRHRRHRRFLLPALLGLLLFGGGFLLGVRQAAALSSTENPPVSIPLEPLRSSVESNPAEVSAAQKDTAWNLRLVNGDHPLSEDFAVPELTELKGGHAVDSRVYPALQQMMDDCRAAGLEPLICSSYRTRSKQAELFQKKIDTLLEQGYSLESAETTAAQWVARPGTSEHETGLAVDIVDSSYQMLDQQQEQTPVQQWMMSHCAEYGFILRYPTSKSELTGIGYEPWHYRYVGVHAAKEITEQGLCLEEYLGE